MALYFARVVVSYGAIFSSMGIEAFVLLISVFPLHQMLQHSIPQFQVLDRMFFSFNKAGDRVREVNEGKNGVRMPLTLQQKQGIVP